MSDDLFAMIRRDCLTCCESQPEVRAEISDKHICVTGGTGFLGSWIAETIAALNDEYQLGITLDLYARNTLDWAKKYPHLALRRDIRLISQDVRSPFEFDRKTNFIVHAAGLPNNRVHSSDPLRVFQTTVTGITNALDAAAQLEQLQRFINVSSCLVSGPSNRQGPLSETEFFPLPCGQLHTVYAQAKRAAEDLASIYRSQFRLPISTVRPFTFAGPYQELDRPWALNSFLRDVLTGSDIRMHGDGSVRRSYLYGSDAAWWTLAALARGQVGAVYNIGSPSALTHLELVRLIEEITSSRPNVVLNTELSKGCRSDELFPDTILVQQSLRAKQTCSIEKTIEKTWNWYGETI